MKPENHGFQEKFFSKTSPLCGKPKEFWTFDPLRLGDVNVVYKSSTFSQVLRSVFICKDVVINFYTFWKCQYVFAKSAGFSCAVQIKVWESSVELYC